MSEMGKELEPGRLTQKWWQTKKITEWEYSTAVPLDPKMVERFGDPVVHVNLVRKSRSDEEGGDTVFFVARCDWFGNEPRDKEITAKDLGTLERMARERLDDCVLAQSGIVWSDWLEVKISSEREADVEKVFGKRRRQEVKRSCWLSVRYEILKRARLPDGRDMMLESGWSMKAFPTPKKAGERTRGLARHEYDHRDEGAEYAYLPATPENIAALDAIADMIEAAGDRLQSILAQKQIAKTIEHVGKGLPLLEVR